MALNISTERRYSLATIPIHSEVVQAEKIGGQAGGQADETMKKVSEFGHLLPLLETKLSQVCPK